MEPLPLPRSSLSRSDVRFLRSLSSPARVQAYLDALAYSTEERYRSPATVLRERKAHCFDGALLAAAALRLQGFLPRIVEMLPNDRDDDHLLAVYRRDGRWGAVAKSNFAGLTFREPVYASMRELVMSYFEQYFNVHREKTLRAFARPLDLRRFDRLDWMGTDAALDAIAEALGRQRIVRLLTPAMVKRLSRVDDRSFAAGLAGANRKGLYQPEES